MSDKIRNRILVVEDAGLVRRYYRQILEGAGYVVDEALNGVEAMERLMGQSFDLLIVDVNMPKMDGLSFLRQLRQKPTPLGAIPAIVATTESEDHDRTAATAAGANFYLIKPLSGEMLLEHVGLMCGRRHG